MAAYYASPTGNDANNGLSSGAPKTLNGGYAACNPGDTLFLLPGTYSQKFVMNRNGSSGLPITVTSLDLNNKAVISGGGTNVLATGLDDKLIIIYGDYNVLDGIDAGNFIYYNANAFGAGLPGWGGYPVYIDAGADYNTLRRCNFHDCGGFGIVACGREPLIEYNAVYNIGMGFSYYIGIYPPNVPNWGSGISLQTRFDLSQSTWSTYKNIGGTIRYNTLNNIYGEGIIVMRQSGATSTIRVYGNDVRNCMAPHLYITNSDHVDMYNNIVSAPDWVTLFGNVRGPGRGLCIGNEYPNTQNADGCRYLNIYNNLVYGTANPLTYFIQSGTGGFAQLADTVIAHNHFLDGMQGGGGYGNTATTVNLTTGNISNVQLRNNVITQTNAAYAVFAAATTSGLITSHNRWDKTPSGLTLGTGETVGDPSLQLTGGTNPVTPEYFRPASGSPLIGAGTYLALVPTDYDGVTRPNPPTIGALEFDATSDWAPVSSPKTYVDIGSPAVAGQAEYSPSLLQYRITASGADMWGTADSFGGFYEQRTGDFTLVYRVESQVGGGASYKAGCDVRTALTAGARHVSINQTGGGVIQRLIRTADDGTTSAANAVTANAWHRIARSGNSLITAHSADGATWTTVATDDITGWGDTLYVMQIECANGTSLATATYSNWVLTSAESSVITALGGGEATLTTEVAEQLDAAILAAGGGVAVLVSDYSVPAGDGTGGAVLGHTNRIDAATLSGGSWNASYPLANLKTRYLQQKARSSNALIGSTVINLDLGAARSIGVVALIAHNLTADSATVRIQGADNTGQSPTLYDSDALPVYQGTDYALTFPEASARYWRISMADTGNAAGYVTLGRLFIGSRFKPTWGASFGSAIGIGSNSVMTQASGGNKFARKRATWRTWKLDFNYLSDAESYGALLAILRAHDITDEFYAIIDATDTLYRGERHMLCSVKQLPAMAHPYVDINSVGLELEELV